MGHAGTVSNGAFSLLKLAEDTPDDFIRGMQEENWALAVCRLNSEILYGGSGGFSDGCLNSVVILIPCRFPWCIGARTEIVGACCRRMPISGCIVGKK